MQVGADWCWLILIDSQWCWLMLINYDWFWIMIGWMDGSFQFYTFELLHCSRLYNKFFFEIEAGLNDLPHGAHLCRYTTDWMINCFLKSTGKLLRCCTSETTQRTWEEIQRINQEKSSCNNFSHLLMTHRILHLTLSLRPGEKRKCKMDFRTNTKDLTWEIMAWWNYEKSFTCGWDIIEEGCPVLQSTPS